MKMEKNVIYEGDCLDGLRHLPDNSIDCCVTSPPYWGLRDYGTAEWIGGDEDCDHQRKKEGKNCQTGHNQGFSSGDGIYKEVCKKCGAKREDSQIGLEETPELFVKKIVEVFREVRRVLKPEGTLWLNLGDSYSGIRKRTNSQWG